MDLQLSGRVILVVGGTGLLGAAVARRLRDEGATAVTASRSGSGDLVVDVRDDESVAAAMAEVLDRYGRLDGLVVAAAPSAQTLDPAKNSDPAQVLEAVDAKAVGFLRVANAALEVMAAAGYGRVVGIAGQNAFVTGNVTGAVRNAALVIAAKNLADAVAGTGVTVNTVNPGPVRDELPTSLDVGPGIARPADVADLVAFLVSPLAAAVSGESIAVGHRARGASFL